MNISEKLTLQQLAEILATIKKQEANDIEVVEVVNQIKSSILSVCSTS